MKDSYYEQSYEKKDEQSSEFHRKCLLKVKVFTCVKKNV